MLAKKFIFCILFLSINLLGQQQSVHQIIGTSNKYTYATTKNKLFVFTIDSQNWREILSFAKKFTTTNQNLRHNSISASCCDSNGNLWILSSRKIAVYFHQKNQWEEIKAASGLQGVSPSIFVKVGMVHWNQKIWIAAQDKLLSYDMHNKKWSSEPYPIGISGGMIYIGLDKRLWLSGRASFDGKGWQKLPPVPSIWQQKQNESFAIDSQGRPWIITDTQIYFFDFLQKKWLQATPSEPMTRLTSITCFQNEMWVCDYGNGIFKLIANKWEKIAIDKPRPSLGYGHNFFVTSNTLWINTYFGVGSFDGQKWESHFDYTQYNSVNRLFYSTLASIIILLIVWIVSVFTVNRFTKK
ncbi:two-component regulator propeller domain-containing protein [Candidatus Uabimicrobium sp. HlEnr_7]|uniref:two-component regulator propeller domain-containing protein n=1 Tax=Candidatus Uabimicrobium helgolandensis TaxID=3095367 RepID=UPI003558F9DE